jgi:maltose alpha-D-glucosyltransferase/alpha-amylase
MEKYRRSSPDWTAVAAAIPPAWLREQRWFQRKSAEVDRVRLLDALELDPGPPSVETPRALLVLEITMAGGLSNIYLLPVALRTPAGDDIPGFAVDERTVAVEALADGALHAAVRRFMDAGSAAAALNGTFHGEAIPSQGPRRSRTLARTSSNTLVLLEGDEVLKYIRRLEPGANPELEMNRFFATHGDFVNLPALTGALQYRAGDGREFTLAMALRHITNEGDAWHWTLAVLAEMLSSMPDEESNITPRALERVGSAYGQAMTRLADVLGHMHRVLCSGAGGPAFAPEPIRPADLAAWSAALVRDADELFDRLARTEARADERVRDFLDGLPRLRHQVRQAGARVSRLKPEGLLRCRVHGDFHLGQVLRAGDDFYVIDFEGEPLRARTARTAKHSPLKDVAGLFRSFNYAAYAALFAFRERLFPPDSMVHALEGALLGWCRRLEEKFLKDYVAAAGRPVSPAGRMLLAAYKLEKALYELDYEINNRPDWLPIPARGIGDCLAELLP